MRAITGSILITVALLGGCATLPPAPSLGEVAQMSKQGVPSTDIIKRLEESQAVYRLSGSKLAELHDEGVPDQVLDYIYQSHIDAVRREEMRSFYGSAYPYPYSYYGGGWGHAPYGPWPYRRR